VAPRLCHVDAASGITISERPNAAPFRRSAWSQSERIERVAAALRHLHQGPPFPPGPPILTLLAGVEQGLRARAGQGLPPDLTSAIGEACEATRRWAEAAPCHCDLNPGNILEAPDRAYLVDWENACACDPFLDLGQLGVFAFPGAEDRDALLAAYVERTPSEEERARAVVGRVMALAYYAAAFMMLSAEPCGEASAALAMPALLDLLATRRQDAPHGVVAASLLEEMRRERSGPGARDYERARATLR
jgi:aminoglycoside phosphotransferase (APT) family kinase protein